MPLPLPSFALVGVSGARVTQSRDGQEGERSLEPPVPPERGMPAQECLPQLTVHRGEAGYAGRLASWPRHLRIAGNPLQDASGLDIKRPMRCVPVNGRRMPASRGASNGAFAVSAPLPVSCCETTPEA